MTSVSIVSGEWVYIHGRPSTFTLGGVVAEQLRIHKTCRIIWKKKDNLVMIGPETSTPMNRKDPLFKLLLNEAQKTLQNGNARHTP